MVVKLPPAKIVVPINFIVLTVLLALGFHVVAFPVDKLISAILFLDCPPTLVVEPPIYAFDPFISRVSTVLFGFGFQVVITPSDFEIAIKRLLLIAFRC